MVDLTDDQKAEIIKKMIEKKVEKPCPRCGNQHFVLMDGYFNQSINAEVGSIVLGGKTLPSIVTACSNCGFLSQHALGALGLIKPPEKEEKE